MVQHYKRKIGSRRYNSDASAAEAAANAVRDGLSQREAALKYGISRGTIQNRLSGRHSAAVGHPTVLSAEEELIVKHLLLMATWGFPVDKMGTVCSTTA